MNGGTAIQPTVELATTNGNGFYPYPYYGNNNNGSFFGSEGIWAIVLLALLFNGGWGNNFGGNGFNNIATTDYISSEFTQRDINNGFQNMSNLVSDGFANNATNICNLRSDVLENRYANQLATCTTQRDILMQTTQLENQLATTSLQGLARLDSCCCDIKNAIHADGEQTRALITQNTIQDLRDRLAAANDVISDQKSVDTILSRLQPTPTPSYLVASPYQSLYNPYNCGCNNGCGNFI